MDGYIEGLFEDDYEEDFFGFMIMGFQGLMHGMGHLNGRLRRIEHKQDYIMALMGYVPQDGIWVERCGYLVEVDSDEVDLMNDDWVMLMDFEVPQEETQEHAQDGSD